MSTLHRIKPSPHKLEDILRDLEQYLESDHHTLKPASAPKPGDGKGADEIDLDQEKLNALCDAVKKVNLEELGYKGSQLKYDMDSNKAKLTKEASNFGTGFASAEGNFEARVQTIFTQTTQGEYNTWDNVLYIFWLKYAAHTCNKEVQDFVDTKLGEWLAQQELLTWYSNNKQQYIIDPNSFKLKKVKPSGDDEGGAGGTSGVTKDTPFTIEELRKVKEQLDNFTIDDLKGLDQSSVLNSFIYDNQYQDDVDDVAKQKIEDLIKKLKNDLNENFPATAPYNKYFMSKLFSNKESPQLLSYLTHQNQLRFIILAICGINAKIENFYERLISTVIDLHLGGWDSENALGFISWKFDANTLTLKPDSTLEPGDSKGDDEIDPDQGKLNALCEAVKQVTLAELEYEDSQLKYDMNTAGAKLNRNASTFGTRFASAEGKFEDRVQTIFAKATNEEYILYIVWLKYAAHTCSREVLDFVDAKLGEWSKQQELSGWYSSNTQKYIDPSSFKLKRATSSGDGEGGAGGTSEVTKGTPFTADDLQKVADEIAKFTTIEVDLPGLEKSQFFAEWMKKDYEDNRERTKKRANEILQELNEGLNSTALKSARDMDDFIKKLFATSKHGGSYHIFSNELKVMILAIAGDIARIENVYGRLINTLIRLNLKSWGEKELNKIANDYFDITNFAFQKKSVTTDKSSSTTAKSSDSDHSSEVAAADPDKDKLDKLCEALEHVTLKTLGYEGSALKAKFDRIKVRLDETTSDFGNYFALHKGTSFADTVKETLLSIKVDGSGKHSYMNWLNVLRIVYLRYAAFQCGKEEMLKFVDTQLSDLKLKLSDIDAAITIAGSREYIDNGYKLKKAPASKPASGGEGSSTTGGTVTKDTPFTEKEVAQLRTAVGGLGLLPGFEQSLVRKNWNLELRKCQQYFEDMKKVVLESLTPGNFSPMRALTPSTVKGEKNSVCTWESRLSILILLRAGANANIPLFYDRLKATLYKDGEQFSGSINFLFNNDLAQYLEEDHYTLKKAPPPVKRRKK